MPCSLYLISPPRISDTDAFLKRCEGVFAHAQGTAAAVACFQLRLKAPHTDEEIIAIGKALLPICHRYDCALIINDDPHLAKTIGADGVHLGQDDMPYSDARALLGDEASIGVTCHNSTDLAFDAGEAGADYVAFGAFFDTNTKEVKHKATSDILRFWQLATTVPCVAIGGITPQNAAEMVTSGADFIAVSGAVWQHKNNPSAAIDDFNVMFNAVNSAAS